MKNVILSLFLIIFISLNAQQSPDTLRVMSFNILHGATTKGDFNLEAIAGFINKYHPDLVAMQEVDFKTNRSKKYNIPLELGYRTQLLPLYAKAMHYDGGEYGEALLSKFSLISTENMALPHLPDSEPRAAQIAIFETSNGNKLQFIATHLDHQRDETDRLMQADALAQRFKNEELPTILAGDLNSQPDSKTMKKLYEVFTKPADKKALMPTYPSSGARICIDHILFNQPEKWTELSYEVVCDEYITDHCVVVTTLVFNPNGD
ncbi:endonuclease/exonuclease/phosphatase family protein [Galbibacter pacificus]|uniref:Endonuclease/exonuclease/phosphatase family protein n=1 Tax=Galbibacter pacificus TaxID=2996052 RepID=A0ABT6FQA4_9FLAO|nr:endonuclease/exonuclease/phosphatase family protein [Galbibacter pacificus]MDG3582074.1 endonuclease/exonuclease/phosphatase family protein [Galbibacter pacificus]MDG3585450.1 endonuclease/exonuclease/phosphatase family protein [Galbibacter pacificus]